MESQRNRERSSLTIKYKNMEKEAKKLFDVSLENYKIEGIAKLLNKKAKLEGQYKLDIAEIEDNITKIDKATSVPEKNNNSTLGSYFVSNSTGLSLCTTN